LRAKALSMMALEPASPKEIAAAMGMPVANVAYHVRELEKAGLIELVERKRRRGAIEHFYLATVITDEQSAALDRETREMVSNLILQTLIGDAALAADAGTLDERPDSHYSHIPLVLDEQGWDELKAIFAKALEAAMTAQRESVDRLEAAGREPDLYASAGLLLFEMPAPDSAGPQA
jgi:DNA-binding transcriptional ArsR family regulator